MFEHDVDLVTSRDLVSRATVTIGGTLVRRARSTSSGRATRRHWNAGAEKKILRCHGKTAVPLDFWTFVGLLGVLRDGSSAAAVTGRAVIDFLHRERRKGVAEAAVETHLQAVFDRQGRSCNRGDSLRDADSVWWREALGPQHKRYGRVSRFATEKEKAEFAAGLCRCGMRVCRCPIGCVVDMDGSPVEPRQFAMSEVVS